MAFLLVPFNYCWILPKLGKKGLNYRSHSEMLELSKAEPTLNRERAGGRGSDQVGTKDLNGDILQTGTFM